MKVVQRDIYFSEFATFTFKQRFYYIWANKVSVSNFNINKNPLKWCVMDLLKIVYIPILYVVLFPVLMVPASFYMSHKLKTKYSEEPESGWYISKQYIIE